MEMAPFIEALRKDLAAIAHPGDLESSELVRRMGAAIEAWARLRLLEAVSQAAVELNAQLPSGSRVDVRLAGSDPALVYVEESRSPPPQADDGLTARISLRLSDALKREIENAASHEGVSVNSWINRALSRGVEERPRRPGRTLRGYARS